MTHDELLLPLTCPHRRLRSAGSQSPSADTAGINVRPASSSKVTRLGGMAAENTQHPLFCQLTFC